MHDAPLNICVGICTFVFFVFVHLYFQFVNVYCVCTFVTVCSLQIQTFCCSPLNIEIGNEKEKECEDSQGTEIQSCKHPHQDI